jgi:hypothetical protein
LDAWWSIGVEYIAKSGITRVTLWKRILPHYLFYN